MRPSPVRLHACALPPSVSPSVVCPVPTVNSKTENHTRFKLREEVTQSGVTETKIRTKKSKIRITWADIVSAITPHPQCTVLVQCKRYGAFINTAHDGCQSPVKKDDRLKMYSNDLRGEARVYSLAFMHICCN